METGREENSKQPDEEVARRSRRGSKSPGSTRMEGICARSREMEGYSYGGKDSNRVINASKEEEEG